MKQLQPKCDKCRCLKLAAGDIQNLEQTQELRLSDGMPDVGRVIGAWGQPIFRSKEWNSSAVTFSAGMMVWLLYAPEDGSADRVLSSWIPFQSRWELPEGTPEGQIRAVCLPRLVDGRSVSPRKLMLRAGMAVFLETLSHETVSICRPAQVPDGVEVLKTTYPIRLHREAGEKAFLLDEELTLPESAPRAQTLIYCTLEPRLLDSRVLSDKLVYRGTANVHLLYRSDAGQYHSWDFEIPFSQFQPLEGVYGNDALGELRFGVTNLEPELTESGVLRLKCSLIAQYAVTDREMVEVLEDAYSRNSTLELSTERAVFPAVLESRTEQVNPEQTLQLEVNLVADTRFLPDFPRLSRTPAGLARTVPGTFQSLYYGEDGVLRSAVSRWETEQPVEADSAVEMTAIPQPPQVQATAGNGNIRLRAQLPVEYTARTRQEIPMITQLQEGEHIPTDPDRPSLILERTGTDRLWDIAKRSGSTVADILRANGLQGEPEPGRMLLIPVP